MKKFLLTDGEFTGMIRTLRSLTEKVRIIGFCSSENCAHSAMLDASYVAPAWNSPEFLPFLIEIINKEKVDYVFPVATLSLEYMARVKDEIYEKTGAFVISSKAESIEISNNKSKLFEVLEKENGIPEYIAPFTTVSTFGELRAAYEDHRSRGIKCITKPVRGENAEGFLKFVPQEEYVLSALNGTASHSVCIESFACFGKDEHLPCERLVMPFLPGKEWDVDVLSLNGKILAATVRSNSDMFGGLSACSTTENSPLLLEICAKIVEKLELSYLSCISFREDENGCPKLLEINPRAMGSIHLSTLAGNNLVEKLLALIEDPGIVSGFSSPVVTAPGFTTSLYYDIIRVGGIKWKPLTAADRNIYQYYYEKSLSRMTDMTFSCRFAWNTVYDVSWAVIEDCLVQVSFGNNCKNAFMLMPLGDLDAEKLEKIIIAVHDDFSSRGLPLKILCIDEEYLPLFDKLTISHSEPAYNDDFSDYLYDAVMLRSLAGRRYSKKRNHYNQFVRAYPDYEYKSLDESDYAECIKASLEWTRRKGADPENADESDHLVIKGVLENFGSIGVKGGTIRIGGRLAAFAIGVKGKNGICYIHFEKGDTDYEGIYAAINKLVLENEFPDAAFVDREEDLGLENLRKAKQSYYPVEMIKKYSVKIS